MSRRYAVISYLKQGYFTITDIGSTNGTFVSGLLLTHNVPQILHSGDTICIGDTVLTIQSGDQFQILPHDIPFLNEYSPTWNGSATDRFVRVKYRPDVKDCTYVISKESENVTVAKLTFIVLSGQLVSGTIIPIKDSNSAWKIDDLQNISRGY